MENDSTKDDGLDELSTLSDREMVETATRELAELRELAKTNPAITAETIAAFEKQLALFTASLAAAEQAERDLAASSERMDSAAENLLTHPDLPNGKSIPIAVSKTREN